LLVTKVLVCRDENVEPLSLGVSQQVAILEAAPTLLVSCLDYVTRQVSA